MPIPVDLAFEKGKGYQSPPWIWKGDPIKVMRLIRDIEEEEERDKKWLTPEQVLALAEKKGLELAAEDIKEFIEGRKEWFERRKVKPWREKYILSITITPRGAGSVTPARKGGPVAPKRRFTPGIPVTLTAIPHADYDFERWTGDYAGTDNPISITMDVDRNLTAHFKKTTTYKLNISITPKAGGSVTPAGGDFKADTEVTLTAVPKANYYFDRWTGALTGSDNPATITMDSNKSVIAHFKKET